METSIEAVSRDDDDSTLVERWRAGSVAAREALVSRHYPSIHRFFDVRLPSMADDLTQQVFVSSLELFERIQEPENFRAFLFGVARNILLRHLRKESRAPNTAPYQTSAGDRTTPSGVVAKKEAHWLVLRALEMLPTDLRIALELYYWEEMNSSDIATVLRVPVSTVTTRVYRARTRLREAVAKLAPEQACDDAEIAAWTRQLASRS